VGLRGDRSYIVTILPPLFWTVTGHRTVMLLS